MAVSMHVSLMAICYTVGNKARFHSCMKTSMDVSGVHTEGLLRFADIHSAIVHGSL